MNDVSRRTRIVLMVNQRMMRDGLQALFEPYTDLEVVRQSDTQALPRDEESPGDVVILGVDAKHSNPIDIIGYTLAKWPEARVVVLAAVLNRVHLVEFFRAGIHGYVTSQCPFEELLEAVRMVRAGSTYLSTRAAKILLEDYTLGGSDRESSGTAPLTEREATLLRWLAEGRTSKEIAASLDLSSKTIDACRRQLMQKLKIDSTAGLIKYALVMEIAPATPAGVR